MSKVTTNISSAIKLLDTGVFVKITFASVSKGAKVRSPEEKLARVFRSHLDHILPEDIRQELANLAQRRYYLYNRYGEKIPTFDGVFVPFETLPDFLKEATEIKTDLSELVDTIISRKDEINNLIRRFYAANLDRNPKNHELLPDDSEEIKYRFGYFDVLIDQRKILSSELLNSMPELQEEARKQIGIDIEGMAQKRGEEIAKQLAKSLTPKVSDFVKTMTELRRTLERKGKLHGVAVRALHNKIKRIEALTKCDPELSKCMDTMKEFAETFELKRAVKKGKKEEFEPVFDKKADEECLKSLSELTDTLREQKVAQLPKEVVAEEDTELIASLEGLTRVLRK